MSFFFLPNMFTLWLKYLILVQLWAIAVAILMDSFSSGSNVSVYRLSEFAPTFQTSLIINPNYYGWVLE